MEKGEKKPDCGPSDDKEANCSALVNEKFDSEQIWKELPEEVKRDLETDNIPRRFYSRKRSFEDDSWMASPGVKRSCLSPGNHVTWVSTDGETTLSSSENDPTPPEFKDGDEDKDFTEDRYQGYNYILKIAALIMIWGIFTAILIIKSEHGANTVHQISVPRDVGRSFWILEMPKMKRLSVEIGGSLLPTYYGNLSRHWASIWVEMVRTNSTLSEKHVTYSEKISEIWKIPIVSETLIDFVPEVKRSFIFNLKDVKEKLIPDCIMRLQIRTNLKKVFPMSLSYDLSPIDPGDGILYAVAILVGLYILIIFEIVHRTLAAVMASTMSIAALAAFDERPSKSELITWIDMETLLLLFSMMVLVAILSETGLFDYLAVFAYKIANGRVWVLINTLCIFTALLSSCLDNVTTVLLMTPITIRLCEVMELNPVPILMSMVIYSNIGGAITPVGDPPNVIIASNKDVIDAGVTFGVFTLHMGVGLIFVMVVVHFQLRFMYRNMKDLKFKEPHEVQELRHEIEIWQRAAGSLSLYSKDEDLVKETLLKKVRRLLSDLKKKVLLRDSNIYENYTQNLEVLREKFPVRNPILLIKCIITFIFLAFLFFFHSTPWINLSLGWTALLGVILLLILADRADLESIFARVEWTTLIFFTALFILMEALSRLGLIDWIGRRTESLIQSVDKPWQLTVAILLILWVSALASSFVDNIPLTTMMVRIITSLSQNDQLDLPLQPLVWSLALGACLGGNGTLIGASSNVVCAGVAEQHGYRFSFMQFLKIGFPVMVGSVLVTSAYLLIVHVALGWH
ncbi:P protein-like isoform X2 [Cimex lectularius]|uniref:Citrate transporter-like domain-containing protein n=1 Tax=Cimex lectularius TaxID=79782 RepID=A0A8I6RA71_CIMLE|nr:P protein-like isoform X2 [Cimex lectularius]